MRIYIHTLVLMLLCFDSCCIAETPEPVMFPDRGCWGVVYQTGDPNSYASDIPMLKKLGVQWVRLTIYWHGGEVKEKGNYDWNYADPIVNSYKDSGLGILCILGLEQFNTLYQDDIGNKDVVLQAITRWFSAVAERYKGRGIVYEMSNEPLHGGGMEGYWLDPVVYTRMCRMGAEAIKKADPTAKISVYSEPFSVGNPYIKSMFTSGILEDGTIDIFSHHAYGRPFPAPEADLGKDIRWLRHMIRRYNKKKDHPVIVADTEKGYALKPFLSPKDSWPDRVYSETEQATYLARHFLAEIAQGVEIIVWFRTMCTTDYGFGLYNDATKPGYAAPSQGRHLNETLAAVAYRNLAHLLPDNPKKLLNTKYKPLVDGSANVVCKSYLKKDGDAETLILAVWNPIEAFEGKILESRKDVAGKTYEAWRAISPEDLVEVPVTIQVENLPARRVNHAYSYNILEANSEKCSTEVTIPPEGEKPFLLKCQAGPVPSVFVIKLTAP